MALISHNDREVTYFLTVGRTYCKVCGYAVKLQKILLIEEFSLYYSDILRKKSKPAVFTLKFFKERIDKIIESNLCFPKQEKVHDAPFLFLIYFNKI